MSETELTSKQAQERLSILTQEERDDTIDGELFLWEVVCLSKHRGIFVEERVLQRFLTDKLALELGDSEVFHGCCIRLDCVT